MCAHTKPVGMETLYDQRRIHRMRKQQRNELLKQIPHHHHEANDARLHNVENVACRAMRRNRRGGDQDVVDSDRQSLLQRPDMPEPNRLSTNKHSFRRNGCSADLSQHFQLNLSLTNIIPMLANEDSKQNYFKFCCHHSFSPFYKATCIVIAFMAVLSCLPFTLCGPIGARDAKKDVTAVEATDYLRNFGYLPQTNPEVGSLISQEGFSDAIARFQRFAGIEQTGLLNEDTKRLMQAPRCGVPDLTDPDLTFNVNPSSDNASSLAHARAKRYAVQGSKWRVKDLSWKVSAYTKKLPELVVNRVLGKALGIWSQYSQLTFKQARHDADAHIDVKFVKFDHGDGDPFDGPGKTLAHAFFPMFGGDAHFDDSEYWTDGTWKGTNLYQVAAHEFGHSLGLSHSDVRTALMAPFYRGYNDYFQLDQDDIQAIQYLYGAHDKSGGRQQQSEKKAVVPSGQPSRRPDPNVPSVCSDGRPLTLKIDALTRTADSSVYAFVQNEYYKLNDYGYEDGFPRKISTDWPGLPNNLDAALTWSDGKTFFFKGPNYWKFKNREPADGYPKPIAKGFAGIPNDVESAFVWSGNGKTYFTKGSQYWRYDSQADPPVSSEYPRDLGIWDGLPRRIDSAFQWKNDKTYFFSGPNYYRFDDHKFTVDKDYPRLAAVWWFGCQVAPTSSLIASPELDNNQLQVASPITVSNTRQLPSRTAANDQSAVDVMKVIGPDSNVPFTPIWRFADERSKDAVLMQGQAALADDPVMGYIDTSTGSSVANSALLHLPRHSATILMGTSLIVCWLLMITVFA